MKTATYLIITALFLQIFFSRDSVFALSAGKEQVAMKAYQLRMKGKTDEAKAILTAALAKDSTDAMAYYELSRLNLYLMTARQDVKLSDILDNIGKAVKLEPKNVIYAYYNALSRFFSAFMAMQQQKQDQVKPLLAETCQAFEKVLELKPDYYEANLYLVEIYGMLPADMGGDSAKAVAIADKLMQQNLYFGARAKADLLPEDADLVTYWKGIHEKDKKNLDIQAELGVSYLKTDNIKDADKIFREVMKKDPSKNWLMLNLARAPMYKVMRNKDLAKEQLPIAINYINEYLKTVPEPVVPLKAYALGLKSRFEQFLGNKEAGEKILQEAKKLDPYFSGASGIPTLLLFDKPDKVSHTFFSFFSPF